MLFVRVMLVQLYTAWEQGSNLGPFDLCFNKSTSPLPPPPPLLLRKCLKFMYYIYKEFGKILSSKNKSKGADIYLNYIYI